MKVLESIETVTEVREVTVTMGFEFENGVLKNEDDQSLYDLVKPVGDEIVNNSLDNIKLDDGAAQDFTEEGQ